MYKNKIFIAPFIMSFALSTFQVQAQAIKVEEILPAFSGLVDCDGSKNAETICRSNCTGDGLMLTGTCSDQSIWDHCRIICRQDWIENCSKTASKHHLIGLPQCQ